MKTMLFGLVLLVALGSQAFAGVPAPPQGVGVSFGVFYSSLDNYGEWIQLEPEYYVWRPLRIASGWRPYFYGEWAWTPDGWYWVSDEPWAWAVYHYGRWYYDDYYGWVWVPGYDWAPAWVEWRYSEDVIGWAPLGPYAVFGAGFGIHYYHSWVTPNSYWCFVGLRYMGGPRIHRHIYGVHYNHRYLGMTRSVGGMRYENHRVMNHGPERGYIEQRRGGRIPESRVVDVRDRADQRVVRRGEGNEIRVYRPEGRTPRSEAARPGRLREAERKPALDLRSTDLVQRGGRRQAGETREAPRVVTPAPRQEPASPERETPREGSRVRPAPQVRSQEQQRVPRSTQPERVVPREGSRVQPAPQVRPQEQKRTPRSAQPEVRREVQPRRDQGVQTFRRQAEQRMTQRERPAQAQPGVRAQQVRPAERAARRAEPQRTQRPKGERGARRTR